MPFVRLNLGRVPYIGVFSLVTDRVALFPKRVKIDESEVEKTLGVPVVRAEIMRSPLLGVFLAGNSRGVIAPELLDKDEERTLRDSGIEVTRISGRFTALGNLLLVNDKGGLASIVLPQQTIETISSALEIPIERGTIAGLKTVGTAGVVTNKGALVHPDITEEELETMKQVLKVPVLTGTACDGEKYVGICVVANSRSFLAGEPTTGAELGRIENALELVGG